MKKDFNDNLGRGVGNTPLTTKYHMKKRVLIDYLSITFDWLDIEWDRGMYHLTNENQLLELNEILGNGKMLPIIDQKKGLNGYEKSITLGEHIRINFGGLHTRSNGNETANLLMTGEACREFSDIYGGSFHKLFKYFKNKGYLAIKRLDIAIDVFDDSIIDIYDLSDFVRKGHYTSPMSKFNLIESGKKTNFNGVLSESDGFTITLGSPGGNQLQIYDKKLERQAKNVKDLDVDIWYRWEMRLTDSKADTAMSLYVLNVEDDNSKAFMSFASSILLGMFKPRVVNNNTSNLSMCDVWQPYLDFVKDVKEIDLKTKHNLINTTIERKKDWYDYSIQSTNAEFALALDDDGFIDYILKGVLQGLYEFDDKKLQRVNNYRSRLGQELISWEDVEDRSKNIKQRLEELNYKGIDTKELASNFFGELIVESEED
jgi:DNA relaxase NicK